MTGDSFDAISPWLRFAAVFFSFRRHIKSEYVMEKLQLTENILKKIVRLGGIDCQIVASHKFFFLFIIFAFVVVGKRVYIWIYSVQIVWYAFK